MADPVKLVNMGDPYRADRAKGTGGASYVDKDYVDFLVSKGYATSSDNKIDAKEYEAGLQYQATFEAKTTGPKYDYFDDAKNQTVPPRSDWKKQSIWKNNMLTNKVDQKYTDEETKELLGNLGVTLTDEGWKLDILPDFDPNYKTSAPAAATGASAPTVQSPAPAPAAESGAPAAASPAVSTAAATAQPAATATTCPCSSTNPSGSGLSTGYREYPNIGMMNIYGNEMAAAAVGGTLSNIGTAPFLEAGGRFLNAVQFSIQDVPNYTAMNLGSCFRLITVPSFTAPCAPCASAAGTAPGAAAGTPGVQPAAGAQGTVGAPGSPAAQRAEAPTATGTSASAPASQSSPAASAEASDSSSNAGLTKETKNALTDLKIDVTNIKTEKDGKKILELTKTVKAAEEKLKNAKDAKQAADAKAKNNKSAILIAKEIGEKLHSWTDSVDFGQIVRENVLEVCDKYEKIFPKSLIQEVSEQVNPKKGINKIIGALAARADDTHNNNLIDEIATLKAKIELQLDDNDADNNSVVIKDVNDMIAKIKAAETSPPAAKEVDSAITTAQEELEAAQKALQNATS